MHAKVWEKKGIFTKLCSIRPHKKPPPTYPMKGIRAAVVRLTFFGGFVFFIKKAKATSTDDKTSGKTTNIK